MAPSLRELLASTPLSGGNAPYVEALYEQFLADPQSVDPAWRDYFQRLQDGLKQRDGAGAEQIHSTVQAGIVQRASKPRMAAASSGTLSARCRRQAGRGLAPGADLREPRPPHRQPRSAGPRRNASVRACSSSATSGSTDADLDTEFLTGSRPSELAPQAQAARNHRATRIRVLRHHRRRVRARVEHRRAPVAAGPVPARAG